MENGGAPSPQVCARLRGRGDQLHPKCWAPPLLQVSCRETLLGSAEAPGYDLLLGSDDYGQPPPPSPSQPHVGRLLAAPTVISASCPQAKGRVHGDITGARVPLEHGKASRDTGTLSQQHLGI